MHEEKNYKLNTLRGILIIRSPKSLKKIISGRHPNQARPPVLTKKTSPLLRLNLIADKPGFYWEKLAVYKMSTSFNECLPFTTTMLKHFRMKGNFCSQLFKNSILNAQQTRKVFFYPRATLIGLSRLLLVRNGAVAATLMQYIRQLPCLLPHWATFWPSYILTELHFDRATFWLKYILSELHFDWAIFGLSYNLTGLIFDWNTFLTVLQACHPIKKH